MSQTIQPIQLELDLGQRSREALRHSQNHPDMPLRDFLAVYPARPRQPLPEEYYDLPLKHFQIVSIILKTPAGSTIPTPPPGRPAGIAGKLRRDLDTLYAADLHHKETRMRTFPERLSDNEAVQIAYGRELAAVARYLEHDLSVLIMCDKILTEHIYDYVCKRAGKKPVLDDSLPPEAARATNTREALDRAMQGTGRGTEANLPTLIRALKGNEVLVLRSVDILDSPPLVEALYQGVSGDRKPQLLGFLDPSLEVKKVLTSRFAVPFPIMGLSRYEDPDTPSAYIVSRLITAQEYACFKEFDPEGLYKNVSGLNAIQFRNAMRYVGATVTAGSESRKIYDVIRDFKTSSSDEIEIPDTAFDDIGGYERVKKELKRVVALATGRVAGLDERERQKLIPRGFIFHGPPGTGKTLFAKAIANEMNATIQMVSGPEVMDKYVGQSESNLRHIFATARRNAPSVIFFDEFDSVASQRSTYSDGGSRANNAVVAQLLTELDGFREDQAVLVIGTTNRIDIIDEALLRPSRLRPIEIGPPDYAARRSVAGIHAQKFGVDILLCALCEMVLEHLPAWIEHKQVPPAFLDALFKMHPPCKERYKTQVQTSGFLRELQELFQLVQSILQEKEQSGATVDSSLVQVKERLQKIAGGYQLDFAAPAADPANAPTPTALQSMQTDLVELFSLLQGQTSKGGGFSPEKFLNSILDLLAEYTEGFNNDEIRAIFQEASLEYHLEGQLITPRYLGMKVGLIRKRRDERQMVHLSIVHRSRR